jgi:enoyl-CoA hydratase/carnithine racemase
MTGEPISATEAERLGIVNKVVPPDELMEAALTMARTISERPQQAVRMAKQLVNDGIDAPLDTAITMETGMTATLYDTQDAREGIRAFFEKREPQFTGR